VAAAMKASGFPDIDTYYEQEKLDYKLELNYSPDWTLPSGVILEAKGKFDYDSRRKMLAVKTAHPERDIRMLFMRNNKLGKGSKMRYGEWCDKHGFPWSVYPDLPVNRAEVTSE